MSEESTIAPPQAADTTEAPASEPKKLHEIIASADHQYAIKNYNAAAEIYSEATSLQAEQNGEMAVENADLLYAYGRCLYKVAVANSDVLGGKVAGESQEKKKRKRQGGQPKSQTAQTASEGGDELAEKVVEKAVEAKDGMKPQEEERKESENTPYFQITGDDEDWDDSESEQDDEEAENEAIEEEDDFATAYEILDVARLLLTRRIEASSSDGKGKGKEIPPEVRLLKERLADTHDLQAEISLENERFADAVTDSRASLALKEELFPQDSSIYAEAHFKLSLALEFASVTSVKDVDGEPTSDKDAQVDETLRGEAASHMQAAIDSSKARVVREKKALQLLDGEDKVVKENDLKEVTDIIQDMEQRLEDLRNPAVAMNGPSGPVGAPDGTDPLGGILGSMLGESQSAQKARLDEAMKNANDLSGLVRHKKKPKHEEGSDATASAVNGNGKRSAAVVEDQATSIPEKKARTANGS